MCKRNVNQLKNLVTKMKIVMILTFALMANVKESASEIGIVKKDLCKIFFVKVIKKCKHIFLKKLHKC